MAPPQVMAAAAAAAAVSVLALKLLFGGRKDGRTNHGSTAHNAAGTSHPAMATSSSSTEAAHAPLLRSSSSNSTSAIVVNGNEDLLNSPLVQFALARLDSHPPSPRAVPASPSVSAHSPSYARSYTSTPTREAHTGHAQGFGTPKSPSDSASSKVYDPQAYNRSYSPSVSPAESPRSFPSPDIEVSATAEADSHRYQPSAAGRTAKKLTTGARAVQSTAQSVIYSGAQDGQTGTAHKRSGEHQTSPSPAWTEPQHETLTPLQQLRKITPLPHEQQPTTVKAHNSNSAAMQQPAASPPAAPMQQQQQQQPASRAPATATTMPQAAPAPVATAATQQEAVRSQTAPATAAAATQPASLPAEVPMQQPVSPTRELPKHLTVKTGADSTQQHANTQQQNVTAPAVSPAAAHNSPIRSSPTSNTEGSAAKSIIYGSGDAPSPTNRRYTKAVPGQYATKETPSPSPVISSYVESQTTPPPSMRTGKVSPLPVSDSKPSPAPELKQESSLSKVGSQDSSTAWTARGTTDANPAMKGILYGGNLSAKDQPKRYIRNVEGQYATKTTAIFGDPSLNSAPSAPLGESPRASLRNSRNREVAGKIGGR